MKIQEEKLEQAVDTFVVEMKKRLAKKEREGYGGWDRFNVSDTEYACQQIIYDAIDITRSTSPKLIKKLATDIANRAMMIAYDR